MVFFHIETWMETKNILSSSLEWLHYTDYDRIQSIPTRLIPLSTQVAFRFKLIMKKNMC